ncbi:MAG: N-acetyltransferase [Alphaproteobacteria bacterium]|nr:N-acetyltransferase [Alphaproteobacteria bacterium]MCB9929035.1 N-acetyltransferase [Alphaproteobacteria bacterium]
MAFQFHKDDGDGRHGRYVATMTERDGTAEILFTRRGRAHISADHAEAPPHLRGTGIAAALVAHMVADARATGLKVTPVCTYIALLYRRHPEWHDTLAEPLPARRPGAGTD